MRSQSARGSLRAAQPSRRISPAVGEAAAAAAAAEDAVAPPCSAVVGSAAAATRAGWREQSYQLQEAIRAARHGRGLRSSSIARGGGFVVDTDFLSNGGGFSGGGGGYGAKGHGHHRPGFRAPCRRRAHIQLAHAVEAGKAHYGAALTRG